jgi:hypothetical protein
MLQGIEVLLRNAVQVQNALGIADATRERRLPPFKSERPFKQWDCWCKYSLENERKKSWMKSQPFLTNTRDSLPPFKYESLMQYSEENGNRHCKKCKMRQSSGDSGSRQQQRMAMRELLILVQVSL